MGATGSSTGSPKAVWKRRISDGPQSPTARTAEKTADAKISAEKYAKGMTAFYDKKEVTIRKVFGANVRFAWKSEEDQLWHSTTKTVLASNPLLKKSRGRRLGWKPSHDIPRRHE